MSTETDKPEPKPEAMVTRRGILDMQVCVPSSWTDEQVKTYADATNPCGTDNGWSIRRAGSSLLKGDPERTQCFGYSDRVHIMLDA